MHVRLAGHCAPRSTQAARAAGARAAVNSLHPTHHQPLPNQGTQMERNPWWAPLAGKELASWDGPVGIKADGGGSIRGCGRVGSMLLHKAACNRDAQRKWGCPGVVRTSGGWGAVSRGVGGVGGRDDTGMEASNSALLGHEWITWISSSAQEAQQSVQFPGHHAPVARCPVAVQYSPAPVAG